MKKQMLLVSTLCATLAIVSACKTQSNNQKVVKAATPPAPVVNNDPVANVKPAAKDPNRFSDYGLAMTSTAENPLLSKWQVQHAKEIAAATTDAKLDAFLASDAAADALLAKVKEAYKSDPIAMIQIASVTQRAQVSSKEALARWIAALKRAQQKAPDQYRKTFYRDQLILCGGIEPSCKAACAAKACCSYPCTIDEGFVSLFNGKDLTGWKGSKMYDVKTIDVKLNNGTVRKETVLACFPERKIAGDRGNLITEKQYENFILRFEFCMPENGNNGLGIRTPSADVDAAYEGMCELQLLDDGGSAYYDKAAKKDKLKPYQYTGSVYGIFPSLRDNVGKQLGYKEKNFTGGGSYVRKPGMWNFQEVKVIGSEIEVYLNGYLITKGDVSKFKGNGDTPDKKKHPGLHNKKGHIGWLGHGHNVMWKNIRIKELPSNAKMSDVCPRQKEKAPKGFTTYFDGCPNQLKTMWKGVTTEEGFDNPIKRQAATPAKRAEMQKKADLLRDKHWSVRNGNLYFDGYRGGYSLATIKDLKDFELWADWRTMSITGDSGLYLRGTPQVQIWDAYNQWGIGSGGLYNNEKNPSQALTIADKQVGDWNRFYVIMKGEKVTVYLNGVLVVANVKLENFWDRTKPIFPVEQLELQCHGDPIEWRNIFIREL